MKFMLLEAQSTDAETYSGMVNIPPKSVVDGVYMNDKQKGILVSGKEMIRVGGCPIAFNEDYDYMIGSFMEVES